MTKKLNQFDEETQLQINKQLEFYTEQISSIAMTVHIDEEIQRSEIVKTVVRAYEGM